MRVRFLGLLALIALGSGCFTTDVPTPATNETAGGSIASVRNETVSIPFDVGTGVPAGPAGEPNGIVEDLEVGANVTAILVEARWRCSSPTCDFDLILFDPEGNEADRGAGSGSAAVEAPNATAGEWGIQLTFTTPVADASGEIRATLFYGGSAPPGFTAFAEASARRSGP